MSPNTASSLYGNLDLLVLRTVKTEGPVHGLGVLDAIEQTSRGTIAVEDGALYQCLHRLERRDLVAAEWRTSEKRRRAKFYSLTRRGRKQLALEDAYWRDFYLAVNRVLEIG